MSEKKCLIPITELRAIGSDRGLDPGVRLAAIEASAGSRPPRELYLALAHDHPQHPAGRLAGRALHAPKRNKSVAPGNHQESSTRSPVSRWAEMGIIEVCLMGMLCAGEKNIEHRTRNFEYRREGRSC